MHIHSMQTLVFYQCTNCTAAFLNLSRLCPFGECPCVSTKPKSDKLLKSIRVVWKKFHLGGVRMPQRKSKACAPRFAFGKFLGFRFPLGQTFFQTTPTVCPRSCCSGTLTLPFSLYVSCMRLQVLKGCTFPTRETRESLYKV